MTELERIPVTSPAGVAVFQRILTHGPIARIDVARATGLSQAAVTKAVHPLMQAGFVIEANAADMQAGPAPTPGRPVSPLIVAPARSAIIGIKVTKARTYGVLTDLTAQVLATDEQDNPSAAVEDIAQSVVQLVSRLRAHVAPSDVAGVGVSVSGDVDTDAGEVRQSPLLGWSDVPLGRMLENRLDLPVTVENDVRALTHAEQLFGTGRDTASFAVVTIGEGIGCGIFVNGDVVEGSRGVAGEIGHLPLAPGNLVCSCGRRGCVETIAGSSAILRVVRDATGNPQLDFDAVIRLARTGDPDALQAFASAGDTIGSALAALANLFGPQVIVIAGEGVDKFDLYGDSIRETFLEHAFSSASECELVLRSHTFTDWARGAAVSVVRAISSGSA
ncbi:ROK family protein [Curtobacterium sp. L1-20]|uniref:ROK family protein n=1 Tax=Curtobacterium sp. L1-20 TaxID=3138181 RepID=UPI003B515D33